MTDFDYNNAPLEDRLVKYANDASVAFQKKCVAEVAYKNLDNQKKNLLAKLMSQYEGSESSKERLARSHPDWIAFSAGLEITTNNYFQASAELEKAKLLWTTVSRIISMRSDEIRKGLR